MATKKKQSGLVPFIGIQAGSTKNTGSSGSSSSNKATSSSSTGSSGGVINFSAPSSGSNKSNTGTSTSSKTTTSTGSKTDRKSTESESSRKSTVTVPTVSAQEETEDTRDKWRRLANWLTSPIAAAVSRDSGEDTWRSNVALSGGKNTAGSLVGAAATTAEALSSVTNRDNQKEIERQRREEEAARIADERQAYVEESLKYGAEPDAETLAWYDEQLMNLGLDTLDQEYAEAQERGRQERERLYDTSARLMQEGEEHKQTAADIANENRTMAIRPAQGRVGQWLGVDDVTVGDLLTDAGVAGVEMLGDVAIGAVTGAGSMVPMLARSFGAGASEAAQNGGDVKEQLYQGAKNAVIEWATEHLFGGNPLYDKASGVVDDIGERVFTRALGADGYNKLVNSIGAQALKIPAGMLEEGLEEAIGSYLNPLADSIRDAARGEGWSYEKPDRGDVSREFITGALLGGIGQVSSVAGNRGGNIGAQQTAPAAAESASLDQSIADIVDTALDVKRGGNEATEAAAPETVEELVEQAVSEPEAAQPMTLEERQADLEARVADWQARVDEVARRGQSGEDVEAEYNALHEEYQTLADDEQALKDERTTTEAAALGEQRAAAGETSPGRGTAENHIDNRWEIDLGDRRIKAFQFDHPELHQYYVEAAQQLMEEIHGSQTNTYRGYMPGKDGKPGKPYTQTRDSQLIKELKGQGIDTLPELLKACQAIIDDNGQENYAAAKRVERFLDRMLTNGYYGCARYDDAGNSTSRVEPNQAYIDAKRRIAGAKTEWQRYLDDSSLLLSLGEVTEEQLADEFRQEHPDLAWQIDGTEPNAATQEAPAQETVTEEAAPQAETVQDILPEYEEYEPGETTEPGTRQTMPEPTLPQVPDGRSGINWENRFQAEATPMPEGMRQSKSYETVKNAEPTSEDMASIMDTEGFKSIARYAATTNQADVDSALAYIRKNGYAASMDSFIREAEQGNSGAELVARGALLLKAASDMGRMRDFADLYVAYKTIGTRAGQTTQAFKIYQKLLNMVDGYAQNLTPDDQIYLMRKTVAEYNHGLKTKKHLSDSQRMTQIELDEGLLEQYRNAKTEERRAEIQQAIMQDVYEQAPSSWVEKLNAWRYFSMLFNPRTHVRNMASNAVSAPVVLMKDKVAQVMEHFFIKDSTERTKATLDLRSNSQDRINMAYASQFYDNFLRDDAGSKWYERSANEIDRNKTIFKKNKLLEGANNLNSKALDVEDVWFSRPAFAIAFARECKLQGITAEDIETGRADAGTVQGMIERAQRYSQEMVFRESSTLATNLAKLANSDTLLGKAVDLTMPFKRTPANILTRGWQYSPMGLVQGIAQYNTKVNSGEMTAAQAIDNIAKGVTGTGLMTLGFFLAKLGALTGGGGDDEKQEGFDKLRGRSDFSFHLFDRYISAENFGFEAIPMLVGASLYEQIADNAFGWDENTRFRDKALDVITQVPDVLLGMTQPVFDTTMLSTVNNIFTDLTYAQDGEWVKVLTRSLANNFINQFFPTILGSAERTFLENRRESTFTDRTGGGSFDVFGKTVDASDSILGRLQNAQYDVGYRLNRIPGVEYNQIPYLDAWGREQDTGNLLERFLNNFLNPTNISKNRDAGVEDELQRLYDAEFDTVFPERPSQSTKVNYHNLTADEYVTYAQTLGQESLAGLESLMSSDDWSKASDEEKAKQIEAVYKMAKDAAELAVDPEASVDAKTQAMLDAGVNPADWGVLNSKMTALTPAGSSVLGWQKLISVSNSDLTDEQKETFYRTIITSDKRWKEYQDIIANGGTMQDFAATYDSYKSGSQYYVH